MKIRNREFDYQKRHIILTVFERQIEKSFPILAKVHKRVSSNNKFWINFWKTRHVRFKLKYNTAEKQKQYTVKHSLKNE